MPDADDHIHTCYIIRAGGHPFELVAFNSRGDALDHIAEMRKLVLYRRAQVQVIEIAYSPAGGMEGIAVERVTTVGP